MIETLNALTSMSCAKTLSSRFLPPVDASGMVDADTAGQVKWNVTVACRCNGLRTDQLACGYLESCQPRRPSRATNQPLKRRPPGNMESSP